MSTPKRHILERNRVFYVFCVKVSVGASVVGERKKPPPKKKIIAEPGELYFTHMGRKTPGPIWTKFCTEGDIRDVITLANFGIDRFRGFNVARDQIFGFSIGFRRRPYNTLALPCEYVIA